MVFIMVGETLELHIWFLLERDRLHFYKYSHLGTWCDQNLIIMQYFYSSTIKTTTWKQSCCWSKHSYQTSDRKRICFLLVSVCLRHAEQEEAADTDHHCLSLQWNQLCYRHSWCQWVHRITSGFCCFNTIKHLAHKPCVSVSMFCYGSELSLTLI